MKGFLQAAMIKYKVEYLRRYKLTSYRMIRVDKSCETTYRISSF